VDGWDGFGWVFCEDFFILFESEGWGRHGGWFLLFRDFFSFFWFFGRIGYLGWIQEWNGKWSWENEFFEFVEVERGVGHDMGFELEKQACASRGEKHAVLPS
jgi:hypothetical protein